MTMTEILYQRGGSSISSPSLIWAISDSIVFVEAACRHDLNQIVGRRYAPVRICRITKHTRRIWITMFTSDYSSFLWGDVSNNDLFLQIEKYQESPILRKLCTFDVCLQ